MVRKGKEGVGESTRKEKGGGKKGLDSRCDENDKEGMITGIPPQRSE